MSDLISRKALAEAIRQAAPKYVPLWVYETIKEQPTAYDPDRIVEQLEEKLKEPRYQHGDEDYFNGIIEAIEIVKSGGKV